MPKTLEEERNAIRLKMKLGEDFNLCKLMCKNYIKKIQEQDKPLGDIKDDLWFGFYNQSYCDKKMGNIRESYINAQKSIQYTDFDFDDYKYSYSLWATGSCTLELNLENESVKIFSECCKMYKNMNDKRFRVLSLFNIAFAHKSPYMMLRIIRIYENNNLSGNTPTYGNDMQRDSILEEMYKNLFKVYIINNDVKSIFMVLHTIKNESIKKQVSKVLVA